MFLKYKLYSKFIVYNKLKQARIMFTQVSGTMFFNDYNCTAENYYLLFLKEGHLVEVNSGKRKLENYWEP